MAKGSVNKVILIGNLGRDPEVRYTPNGLAVANIAIATTESWKDKQTGENQEKTEWHRIALYGRLAEITGEYLRKGGKVYIEGRLQTRKWQDKNGQDRYTTEIIADSLQMLDSKGSSNSSDTAPLFEKTEAEPTMTSTTAPAAAGTEVFEDDIPF